jgi:hypothetical protein
MRCHECRIHRYDTETATTVPAVIPQQSIHPDVWDRCLCHCASCCSLLPHAAESCRRKLCSADQGILWRHEDALAADVASRLDTLGITLAQASQAARLYKKSRASQHYRSSMSEHFEFPRNKKQSLSHDECWKRLSSPKPRRPGSCSAHTCSRFRHSIWYVAFHPYMFCPGMHKAAPLWTPAGAAVCLGQGQKYRTWTLKEKLGILCKICASAQLSVWAIFVLLFRCHAQLVRRDVVHDFASSDGVPLLYSILSMFFSGWMWIWNQLQEVASEAAPRHLSYSVAVT